ncbi:MAG: hypothetical protein LHV68_09695, partial [Elusimicrobia bacterium]|nr:hypothetical protein [Candidatus Liberimonas magnetica]
GFESYKEIKIYPVDFARYFYLKNMVKASAEAGFLENAVKYYEEAAKINPNDTELHKLMGQEFSEYGDSAWDEEYEKLYYTQAVKYYEKAKHLPGSLIGIAYCHYSLGLLARYGNHLRKAMEYIEQAETMDPLTPNTAYEIFKNVVQQELDKLDGNTPEISEIRSGDIKARLKKLETIWTPSKRSFERTSSKNIIGDTFENRTDTIRPMIIQEVSRDIIKARAEDRHELVYVLSAGQRLDVEFIYKAIESQLSEQERSKWSITILVLNANDVSLRQAKRTINRQIIDSIKQKRQPLQINTCCLQIDFNNKNQADKITEYISPDALNLAGLIDGVLHNIGGAPTKKEALHYFKLLHLFGREDSWFETDQYYTLIIDLLRSVGYKFTRLRNIYYKSETNESGVNTIVSQGETVGQAAILPKNLGKVNRWANEGKSALGIALRIGFIEFIDSFNPINAMNFIYSHKKKGGAIFVVSMGIGASILTMVTLGFAMPLVTIMIGFLVGAFANITTHVLLDFHYINSIGLVEKAKEGAVELDKNGKVHTTELREAIDEFGAASVDENGNVHTNVYLMDKLPDDPDKWGLKPTIMVDGERVWASVREGALVLFAEGQDLSQVAGTISETVSPKGRLSGSKRLSRQLKSLFGKLNVELKDSVFKPGITIDHSSEVLYDEQGKKVLPKVYYNEQGNMVVHVEWFREKQGAINSKSIASVLGDMMTIRNAESVAMPQNIYINLNGLTNKKELISNLEVFNKAGNGQMIIDAKIFEDLGLNETQIHGIAVLARKNGVKVCVDLTGKSKEQGFSEKVEAAKYMKLGFSGYALSVGKEMSIHDYISAEAWMKAEVISGYENSEQLKAKLSSSQGGCKILNLSDLEGLLKGGERSIIARLTITSLSRISYDTLSSSVSLRGAKRRGNLQNVEIASPLARNDKPHLTK